MNGMVLDEFNAALRRRDLPVPIPGPGEVLVKCRSCGLCGSDLKIVSGKIATTPLPLVPGHEIAGDVAACGLDVPKTWLGKRVVVHIYRSCLACAACRDGWYNQCVDVKGRLGFELNGGLAEYVTVAVANIAEIPENVTYTAASIAPCAMLAIYHAICRAQIAVDERVVMLGVGGLGLHGVQFLFDKGIDTIAVDVDPKKLKQARTLGADEVMTYDEFVGDDRRHAVILDNIGKPEVTGKCLRMLEKGGRYVMVAYAPGASFSFDSEYMHLNETKIIGTRNGGMHELRAILHLMGEGRVKAIIDRTVPLQEANAALDLIRGGNVVGRIVVDITS